uniref:Uncharacterized protein n=1 Tax=Cacopsylla melanoneura TaxID=428564 RepID=A0A8D9EIK4_9HEMI
MKDCLAAGVMVGDLTAFWSAGISSGLRMEPIFDSTFLKSNFRLFKLELNPDDLLRVLCWPSILDADNDFLIPFCFPIESSLSFCLGVGVLLTFFTAGVEEGTFRNRAMIGEKAVEVFTLGLGDLIPLVPPDLVGLAAFKPDVTGLGDLRAFALGGSGDFSLDVVVMSFLGVLPVILFANEENEDIKVLDILRGVTGVGVLVLGSVFLAWTSL